MNEITFCEVNQACDLNILYNIVNQPILNQNCYKFTRCLNYRVNLTEYRLHLTICGFVGR